jgi:rhodanese-related sulfurtransferase
MPKVVQKKQFQPTAWVWILGVVLILFVAAGVFVLPQLLQRQAALPTEVSVAQAHQLREDGVFVLDVRQPDEWSELHIPGATLIPLDQLEARLSEIPQDQQVLVYCRSGNRSKTGSDILRKAGFDQVTSMAGGIKEWSAAGYPTESGN